MKSKGTVRGFISGVLVSLLLVAMIGTAAATSGTTSINATYADIKIVLDGETLTPTDANGNTVEPFAYNGTTYLPVRAVADAFGKDVTWDGDTNTIYLGAVPSASGSVSYSRTNPAPVGTAQTLTVDGYSTDYTVSVKINSATRGSAAWSLIKAANQFNDAPESGMEYILISATITAVNISDDSAISVSGYGDFDLFSEANVEYDGVSVVEPSPQLDGDIYEGGAITGYLAVMVSEDDVNPKIVYGRNYDGSGGIWFSLSDSTDTELTQQVITLETGTYVVGSDIASGKYSCSAESGDGFMIINSGSTLIYNEMFGVTGNPLYEDEIDSITLKDGYEIQISNVSVKFTPAN